MLCLTVQPLEPEAARLPSTVAYANGASFSFLLNRTTAFFLYGAMRADHDSFAVTIKRSPDNTIIKYLQLNHTSHWFDLKALLYFETELDPRSVYEVTFENVGSKAFSVRYIEVIQVEATDVPLLTPGVSSLVSSQDFILTVFWVSTGQTTRALSAVSITGIVVCTEFFLARPSHRSCYPDWCICGACPSCCWHLSLLEMPDEAVSRLAQ